MIEQVYGEDVEPGEEIGPLVKNPDIEQVQKYMRVGLNPLGGGLNRFTDEEAARREGLSGPILPGALSEAFITQLLTDWAGPQGWIRNLDVSFRRPTLHGEPLRCIGLITDKLDQDDQTLVRFDVFIEDTRGDRPTQGVAEVLIPARRP